jgi:hypothetical protein
VPDDREPFDDIAHLDFDVEDPDLADSLRALDEPPQPPSSDPRNWSPTEDVDDGTWVLSEEDQLLQRQLAWRRHRRGLLFRVAASLVAVGLLALSISALLDGGSSGGDGTRTTVDQDRLDFGPTSEEMADYLVADRAVAAVDPTLVVIPGNTDGRFGNYDNLSLDELNAGGVTAASYGAEAGVLRRWQSPDGPTLTVAIYLFADRGSAESARGRALASATAAGGERRDAASFALVAPPDGVAAWTAARSISRFLVTFDADGVTEDAVEALLAAASEASAAVH